MRITPKQLAALIKNTKDPEELRGHLKYIFEFPENMDSFSKFFFSHAVSDKIPPFHYEIYDILHKPSSDAMAAPRGHAKSSLTGLIYLSWLIVNKKENYIVYVSQNHTKTTQFLTPIRFEFKQNQDLRWVYGDLTPEIAKDEDGKDREDCFDVNGIRIEAVSFEKNMRGFKYKHHRPSLIALDDVEEDERTRNAELRKKDEDKLNRVIIPSLDINGRIKFIGTILHHDSLLAKKIKQYNGKIYQAIDKDGTILWPARFSKEKLDAIKKDIGSLAFTQEYQNNPIDTTSSIIKPEWVRLCYREDVSAEDLKKQTYSTSSLGVDFAFSDAITADESAFVSIGKKDDYIYLFDQRTHRGMSAHDQLLEIQHILHKKYRFTFIGLEENSIKAISNNLSQYNLPLKLFWTAANDPADKKSADYDWAGKRHTVGKFNLISRLGTAFENKRIIIPYKTEEDKANAEKLLAECTSYALADGKIIEVGVHPNLPIALGYALECLEMQSGDFFFLDL